MAKKQTYAAKAKAIMKKYEPRLGPKFDQGDTLALEAMNQELTSLQQGQEVERQRKVQEEQAFQQGAVQKFQDGGKLTNREKSTLSQLLVDRQPQLQQQAQLQQQSQQFNNRQRTFADSARDAGFQDERRLMQLQRQQEAVRQGQRNITGARGAFGNTDMLQRLSPQDSIQPVGLPQPNLGNSPGVQSVPLPQPNLSQFQPDTTQVFAKGGTLPTYQDGNYLGFGNPDYTGFNVPDAQPFATPLNYFSPQTGGYARIPVGQQQPGGGVGYGDRNIMAANRDFSALAAANQGVIPPNFQAPTSLGGYQQALGQQNLQQDFAAPQGPAGQVDVSGQQVGNEQFQFRAPWWGAAATGLGSILGNRQLDIGALEDVEDVEAQQISPRTVSYARGREQIQRERDLAQAQVRGAARGRGTKQGVTQSTIAGATGAQRIAGQQFSQSQEAEANKNAAIRNQAAMFNAQQRAQAGQTNLRTAMMRGQIERENQLINAQRRQNQIAGVTGAITGYGRDLMSAQRDTGYLALEQSPDYPILQQGDTRFKQLMGISADPYKRYTGPGRYINPIQTGG
jgi:hypothetical protein